MGTKISLLDVSYKCISKFKSHWFLRRAHGITRAWNVNGFSWKFITQQLFISALSKFYSISWNVLGLLIHNKSEKN